MYRSENIDDSRVPLVPALVLLTSIMVVATAVCGAFFGFTIWLAVSYFYAVILTGLALIIAGVAASALISFLNERPDYIKDINQDAVLFFSVAPSFTRSEMRSENRPGHLKCIESLSFDELRKCLMKYHHDKRIVIVDDEDFDIYELIEGLLLLRADFPKLKIILLSDSVSADDFSATRAPVCDVTLKKPVSPRRLKLAIGEVDKWN